MDFSKSQIANIAGNNIFDQLILRKHQFEKELADIQNSEDPYFKPPDKIYSEYLTKIIDSYSVYGLFLKDKIILNKKKYRTKRIKEAEQIVLQTL